MLRTLLITLLLATTSITALAQMDPQAAAPPQAGRRGLGRGFAPPVQGIVTAVSSSQVTIKTDAGESYVVTIGENARVMKDRQPIKVDEIKAGDSVTAFGQVDAEKKTVQAMMVSDIDAATLAKAQENLGKTYITGRITAIDVDNLKITVERPDKVSQVIAVDDGTSFQRGMRGVTPDIVAAGGLPTGMGGFGGGRGMGRQGGAQGAPPPPESITMADLKIGDAIMAIGAIKAGTFTVLKMGVSQPGAGRRRGPDAQGDAQDPPPPQQ